MKKKIIIAVLVLAIALSVALAFTLGAGAESAEPSLSIGGKTLVLGNSIYIRYMVAAENANIGDVSLLVWNEAQDSYVKGTEKYEVKWVSGTTKRNGITYYHFDFQDVAAKRLTDNFYTVVYTKVGDTEYYSVPHKYSVLQFAYKTMGKLDSAASTTAGLVPMLEAMLEYGANAQYYFSNYNIDRLANADYYQVKLVGGKLDDGFAEGLYLEKNLVNITADAPASGYYFVGWQNKAGEVVSTDAATTIEVGTSNEVYTAVYEKIETFTVSFVDYNGDVIKAEIVEKGKGATAPAAPERDGYSFIGWDKSFDNVTEDITVIAQYEKNIVNPTIAVESTAVNASYGIVDVVISIANNPGISSLIFEVEYDDCLKLQSYSSAPAFGPYVTAPNDDYGYANPQSFTFISPLEDVVVDGEFVTLTFVVTEDISVDTIANISINVTESYDYGLDVVEFNVSNGTVSIKADGNSSIILPPDIIG